MNKKMKFCFATPQLTGGGAERVVSVLASTLADMGHEVAIIIYDRKDNEYPTSDAVQKYYLCDEKYNGNSLMRRIQRIGYVRKYISSNQFEYVIPFLMRALLQTFWATRGLNIKFISTLRNNPYELSRAERLKTDFVTFFADALYVQNDMQKEYYWKSIQKKTFVLSNPVSDVFVNNSKDYSGQIRKIISVGRLNPQKNYDLLVDAVEIVKQKHPEIMVDIWGLGKEHDRLEKLIESKNLQDTMVLRGRTNNVKEALNVSDLFIMTSDYEGMPNSLLEAMTFGMPCISTDCPTGPADLIQDGINGYLIKMGDKAMLADRIINMIDNPSMARNMGKKARESLIKSHSAEAISKRFISECIKVK